VERLLVVGRLWDVVLVGGAVLLQQPVHPANILQRKAAYVLVTPSSAAWCDVTAPTLQRTFSPKSDTMTRTNSSAECLNGSSSNTLGRVKPWSLNSSI
jgi:hypothetical protein